MRYVLKPLLGHIICVLTLIMFAPSRIAAQTPVVPNPHSHDNNPEITNLIDGSESYLKKSFKIMRIKKFPDNNIASGYIVVRDNKKAFIVNSPQSFVYAEFGVCRWKLVFPEEIRRRPFFDLAWASDDVLVFDWAANPNDLYHISVDLRLKKIIQFSKVSGR